MRILITGGSGFLGRRAAERLAACGHTVLTPPHSLLDVTQAAGPAAWLARHRPQLVLHCAAVSSTAACQQQPAAAARVNVQGSARLAAACAAVGARLVLCSSDQVYFGSGRPGPHTEDEPLTPCGVYGQQKLRAETLCRALCPDTVCLRLSWMYDIRQRPGEHGNFLLTLLQTLENFQGGQTPPLCLPVYDRRGLTDVAQVLDNLPRALALPAGVYNFGSGSAENTCETVRQALRQLGMPIQSVQGDTQAFAAAPRDIRMTQDKQYAFGLRFSATAQGLADALRRCGMGSI